MFNGLQARIHFIGIGGIGMSALAELLLRQGFTVSGSDVRASAITDRLAELGACIHIGHKAENIKDCNVVVRSSAISADNPEIQAAKTHACTIILRAQMLKELLRNKYACLIAGTHGKTTITSLLAHISMSTNLDATAVIGGNLLSTSSNAMLGSSDYAIAEADESDGSFLHLDPCFCAVSNIEAEHLDHWQGGLDELKQAFIRFINNVPFYGKAVLNAEDPGIQSILPDITAPIARYGFQTEYEYCAQDIELDSQGVRFSLCYRGKITQKFSSKLYGKHNVSNILAAISCAHALGLEFNAIANAIITFPGTQRRFEYKGSFNQVAVFDDYAHHPTEIKACLEAVKQHRDSRLIAIFQPHRYSRTHSFAKEFAQSLSLADVVYITDIYAASEQNSYNIHARDLIALVKDLGHQACYYLTSLDDFEAVQSRLRAQDTLITLGAGNIWQFGEKLLTMNSDDDSPDQGAQSA